LCSIGHSVSPAEEGGIFSVTIVQLGLYLMSQSLDNLPTILKKWRLVLLNVKNLLHSKDACNIFFYVT
jgi:hypothetical protein